MPMLFGTIERSGKSALRDVVCLKMTMKPRLLDQLLSSYPLIANILIPSIPSRPILYPSRRSPPSIAMISQHGGT